MVQRPEHMIDLFVVGGGINGCGIARDAAGRGLSVALAEMGDLASATSSASTKLFHGGLRYLEYFEFRLVRHALAERETLLRAMPHISWPMQFVLPYDPAMRFDADTPTSIILARIMPWMKGRRPPWLIRIGLFLYDTLGGRSFLPGTRTLSLQGTAEGAPLDDRFQKAFEYSDCWVEDSRLVALNARDAARLGATVLIRTKVVEARPEDGHWRIVLENVETGARRSVTARMLVNAGGPWVGDIIRGKIHSNNPDGVRLVRGSHIVTKRLYDHDKCYFLQGQDGRIIFLIPYETDYTLIGTTDAEHSDPDVKPVCTEGERDYLIDFANHYLKQDITPEDVVWTYSGVRPLYDDGTASATAATRDYRLKVDDTAGVKVLNVFGGKITTYRKLAEDALDKIGEHLDLKRGHWTAGAPLPGGDFPVDGVANLIAELQDSHPFLTDRWAARLTKAYGTDAAQMLAGASKVADLGRDFGATLSEREVKWLMDNEFARTAEDVVWRRSKLGLKMTTEEIRELDAFMKRRRDASTEAA